MRITDRVVLAGSGLLGMHTSHPLDCNIYLLDGGSECALVDAGSGVEPERLVANIESIGVAMEQVRYLLLTHAHTDHAAGARFFHDRYNVTVVCPHESAPWLENADVEKVSLPKAIEVGMYPPGTRYPACPVDRRVGEGDCVQVGDLTVEVLDTPGHARGHVSYLTQENGQSALLSGDVVFAGGKIALLGTWDSSIQDYAATMAKLHERHIERLYPGHGPFLLSGAYEDIGRAHAKFAALAIPANIV